MFKFSHRVQIAIIPCFFHMEISRNGKIVENVIKVLNDFGSCCLASSVVCHGTRPFNTTMGTHYWRESTTTKTTPLKQTCWGLMFAQCSLTQFKHYQNEVVKVFHFRNFYRYFKWLRNKNYSKVDRSGTCFYTVGNCTRATSAMNFHIRTHLWVRALVARVKG